MYEPQHEPWHTAPLSLHVDDVFEGSTNITELEKELTPIPSTESERKTVASFLETHPRWQSFVDMHADAAVSVIAALQSSPRVLESLWMLQETTDREVMQRILRLGSDVVHADVRSTYLRTLPPERYTPGLVELFDEDLFRTNTLRRYEDFLRVAAEHPDTISVLLNRFGADQMTFFEMYRDVLKRGMDPRHIASVSIETEAATDISATEKEEMCAMAQMNWADLPEVQHVAVADLMQALERPGVQTVFRTLKLEGKIVAFIRFEQQEDGSVFAGSLNVSPFLHGGGVGESFLRAVIDAMAREHVIHAKVVPEKTVGTAYVETFGCVLTGVQTNVLPSDEVIHQLNVLRDDRVNERYVARQPDVTKEMILAEREKPGTLFGQGVRVASFDVSTQEGVDRFVADLQQAEQQGEVVTRYFADRGNECIRYVTFEQARSVS